MSCQSEHTSEDVGEPLRRQFAKATALPMFCLSVIFLVFVATLVVFWVDVPRVIATQQEASGTLSDGLAAELAAEQTAAFQSALAVGNGCLIVLGFLWPLFVLEFLSRFILRDRDEPFWAHHRDGLIACFCPPLRLSARNHDMDEMVWLPWLGWQTVDDALRDRLERISSIPMILIALAILPVLLVEVGMRHLVAANPWLQLLLHVSMGIIWFAFAAEFIIMVSVADKKIRYCKEHWLDLAIILLPLISFLRSLRIVRATRLARVAKIQQLAKMGRLYRLRGLALRAFRAVLLFGVVNRLLRITPEKRLRKVRQQLAEKEAEIESLQCIISDLEEQIRSTSNT